MRVLTRASIHDAARRGLTLHGWRMIRRGDGTQDLAVSQDPSWLHTTPGSGYTRWGASNDISGWAPACIIRRAPPPPRFSTYSRRKAGLAHRPAAQRSHTRN